MKLKVCFCNKTVLKTDITRFAPVWASYLMGLAMMVLLQFSGGSDDTAKNSIVHDFNRLCMLGWASTACMPWWWCRLCSETC